MQNKPRPKSWKAYTLTLTYQNLIVFRAPFIRVCSKKLQKVGC